MNVKEMLDKFVQPEYLEVQSKYWFDQYLKVLEESDNKSQRISELEMKIQSLQEKGFSGKSFEILAYFKNCMVCHAIF